jgi:hypothetical protein
MTQRERFDRLFAEKAAREAVGDSAKKQRKRELNAMAERLGITSKQGKKVFREGRAAMTNGEVVTGKDETRASEDLAARMCIETKQGQRIMREGRRAFNPLEAA